MRELQALLLPVAEIVLVAGPRLRVPVNPFEAGRQHAELEAVQQTLRLAFKFQLAARVPRALGHLHWRMALHLSGRRLEHVLL